MSYDPEIEEEELICLNCPIIPDCDETNVNCLYRQIIDNGQLSPSKRYYQRLKQDPERLRVQQEKWKRNYRNKRKA